MKKLALAVLAFTVLALPACGNGTVVVAGSSSVTVVSINPDTMITVTPTTFQVTGSQFAQAAGQQATVRFTAENGILAFGGGTSNTLDVPVTILDDGTVEGTTPSFLYPGVFNAFVTVILPGTAEGTSATALVTFIGIQVDSCTPNIVPSDSQIPLDIGGTGFSPPAGNVQVSFVAETGTPFLNGTADTVGPVPGTVNSLTSILCNAPIAGVNVNAAAFIEVEFTDLPGTPVIRSNSPIVTFIPPTVDAASVVSVPSEIPTPVTIIGTGYGPVASNVQVTLQADTGTPFLNGTVASLDVTGTVTSNTTIDITTPIFQVQTSTQPTRVNILLNSGAAGASVAPLFSVLRPTVDSVDLANVPSEVPTAITITGTGFAPNGSNPTVRFRAPAGTPFLGGTAAFLDVTGTVVNDTTITCTTPRAGISVAQAADIGVFLTTGITEILSAAPLVTFDPPTIASLAPTMVESEIPQTVTITGTGFGSATGNVNVVLSGAGTPFSLGTQPSLTVLGTITSSTTIDFTSPISGVLADLNADVTLDFPTGASATSSGALLIKTPTVTASSLAAVPSEIPTAITVTGTGFAGGVPTVRFIAAAGTPFSGGTASFLDVPGTISNATTITCTTPRAGVSTATACTIQVRLTGGLNPTSAGTLITFNPPTIASLAPNMVESEIPETVTITGTGFGSVTGNVNVTLSGAGTPFALGTQPSLTVLGTITSSTTIDFTSPISGVLADLNADVSLSFPTGSSVTSAGALLIKTPTVTASSLANVFSEIPTSITITGTGFAGGAPTVRFIAAAGTPFLGGTASFLDVPGTITGPTTVTCTTPRAGLSLAQAAQIQVRLTGGLNPTSAAPLITFDPPNITSIAPTMIESEIPTICTLTGTGFGSVSGNCNVTLSGAGTPFSIGTLPSLTVLGTIVNPTTITFTSPICGVQADLNATVNISFATGASDTNIGLLLIKTPTVVSAAAATVDSEDPTFITITGTGFAGGTPTVVFRNAASPFLGGTVNNVLATGVTLVNQTTITCTTPRAGVLADAGAQIEVQLTGGLSPISPGNIITFTAPTVTSCAPLVIDSQTATLVTVTGTGFYAPGTVTMRFIAAAGTPFSGSATLDVTGTIVNPTTVTGTTPVLALSNKVVCSVAIIFASGAAPTSGPGCTTFEVPPVAVDDNYGVDGNVELSVSVANGVIQGVGTDSDPDGDPITVSAFDAASVQGGTVSVAADGSFTYNPPVGYTGPDSFTYTITDGFLFDTATVNLTVSGMVWFVDNTAVAAGDGRFTSPFNTLAGFIASPLDATGDTIFLYSSATDYTGNLTLLDSQILLGQGVALVHPGGNSVSPLVAAGANPDINSTAGSTVTLGQGNTIRGLDIESTAGTALFGTGLSSTLNADTVNVAATGGPGIDVDGGTLNTTFGTISSTNSSTDGIELTSVAGTFQAGATTVNSATLEGIDLDSTTATLTFASIDINTSGGSGIDIGLVTGSLQVTGNCAADNTGDHAIDIGGGTPNIDFGSLNVGGTVTGAGVRHNGAGTFDVTGATVISGPSGEGITCVSTGTLNFANITISGHGTDGIRIDSGTFASSGTTSTTGGLNGVHLGLATLVNVDFNNLTITTPADDGIFINTSTGTFDVTGRCSIVTPGNAAGTPSIDHGVDINGGSIAVTFADLDVSDSTGHCVEISNTTGAISITGDLGAGDSGGADLHNTDDVGIHCTTCTGTLTFRDIAIDESGDGAVNAQESHGIRIDDCTGNITIDGCVIDDCAETATGAGQGFDNNCVHVRMDDGGTLASLQITDCTFSGTEVAGSGTTTDHGVFIRLEGNSRITDLDVTGCLCNDVGRAFCEILVDGDDSGDACQITNCNVSNNGTVANPIESQGEGVHLRVNGASTVPLFAIDGNIMNGGALSVGPGIRLNTGEFTFGAFTSTASATGTINDNDIDNVGGGQNGGISVLIQESTTLVLEIDNNDVDGVAHPTAVGVAEDGINVRSFDASSGNVTISNNSIGLNTLNIDNGIFVETTFTLAGHSLCVDVFGNNCAAGDDIVMAWVSGVFGIDSLTPTPATAAQVDTFLQAQNTGTANSTGAGSPFTACTVTTP